VAHQGAQHQPAAPLTHLGKTGNVIDVDQHGWLDQAEIHHRQQALPTGDDLRLVPRRGQRLHGVRHAVGPDIIERRRLHLSARPMPAVGTFSSP
jgi:hypothetical protein